jgi:hypothetical protein
MGIAQDRPAIGFIDAHLGSRDVARVIYGAVIGLALVVALEDHPPPASRAASALLATALAVSLAEVYSEAIGGEARTHRRLRTAELRRLLREAAPVGLGAAFPAVFFLLAGLGVLEVDLAFTLSKWTGLGLICLYGFLGARLAGAGAAVAVVQATGVGAIGGLLIVLKALLH